MVTRSDRLHEPNDAFSVVIICKLAGDWVKKCCAVDLVAGTCRLGRMVKPEANRGWAFPPTPAGAFFWRKRREHFKAAARGATCILVLDFSAGDVALYALTHHTQYMLLYSPPSSVCVRNRVAVGQGRVLGILARAIQLAPTSSVANQRKEARGERTICGE